MRKVTYGKKKIVSKKHGIHYLIYDLEDQVLVDKYRWSLIHCKKRGYIYIETTMQVNGKSKHFYFHRLLFPNIKIIQQVDHINRNGKDNRRQNLRLASKPENSRNRPKQKNNTSGYKGVYWHKNNKKWISSLEVDEKKIHIGCFLDVKDAARAYDKAAIKYFKEFAFTNFPKNRYLSSK